MGLEKGPLNQRTDYSPQDKPWDVVMGLEKGPLNQRADWETRLALQTQQVMGLEKGPLNQRIVPR